MEDQTRTSLRFGIMVDDLALEAWKVDAVKLLVEGGMTLALVIRNGAPAPSKGFFQKLAHYPVRRLFFQRWNHRQFKPESKRMKALAPALAPLGLKLEEVPSLICVPVEKGASTFISNNDIESIRLQELDFILRFGFGILKGAILQAARYGVWSYHHDDEMVYRGGPPGFWEWMHNDPRNGVILQRLTESLDRGYVLQKRWYPTLLHSYRAHLDQLYFDSADMPLQVCRELLHTGELRETLSESKASLYRPPLNYQMLQYWIRCPFRRLRFHLHDLFRQEDWDVGYVEAPLNEFLESPQHDADQVHWFRRRRASLYYADPFVVTTSKDTYIFFEQYDYRKGRGCLQAAKRSEEFKKHYTLLEEGYHLSYPSVIEHEGVVYCLPEANASQRINLYRFNEKAMKLEQECVLMEHVRAVDPTLLFRDGRWNLFFTQKDFPSVKLYRYLADDLHGPYVPFFGNPVKVDCADARPAGSFFELHGVLVRPAQDCVRYYGNAVHLNRVDRLDEDTFEESIMDTVAPFASSSFKQGLHTLNGNGTLTVFDGKRWRFTLSGFFRQWRVKRNDRENRRSHV
jgi:hypothetical protein